MLFIIYFLLLLLSIIRFIAASQWFATSTNCLWYQYAFNNHSIKRIDLRDIRNQILK